MADPPLRVDPGERASGGGLRRPGASGRAIHRRTRRPSRRRPETRFAGVLWGAIVAGAALGYFALTLPDTNQLTVAERRPSVTILAADGGIIATFGDLFGQPLTLKEMSPYLPKAVVATEDRRFYNHFGIDPVGLIRAVFTDLRSGHLVQGGSTITQQLAKTVFLSPERNLSRKIREAMLALWLEHRFTKDQILEIYLNRVYLGAGTYGVDAAAHRYFGKSATRLNLYESAVIAGLLKAPTRFNPTRDRDKTAARAAQVLDLMKRSRPARSSSKTRPRKIRRRTQSHRADSARYPLFRRLGRRPGARFRRDLGPRPYRAHHARPAHAERRGERDRRRAGAPRPPRRHQPGRAGGDEPGGRGQGDGRRPRLQREPVQPRDAGAAPGPARRSSPSSTSPGSKPAFGPTTALSTDPSKSAIGGRATTRTNISARSASPRRSPSRSTRSRCRSRSAPASPR